MAIELDAESEKIAYKTSAVEVVMEKLAEPDVDDGIEEEKSEEDDDEIKLNEILQLDVVTTGASNSSNSFLLMRDVYQLLIFRISLSLHGSLQLQLTLVKEISFEQTPILFR